MRTLLFAALAALLAAPAAQAAGTTVLDCGSLFDSRSGRMLGPHAIVVSDGRIDSVTAGAAAPAPGTDAGRFVADKAREFIYMVEAGMPAAEALQAATLHAATVLGVEDQGRIAPGMRADIIALGGNPLDDVQAVMDVRFVMKDGAVYKGPDGR